ncbi:hypothetical protein [Paraburkholderia bannensis]|nr:hypothetical protein [Paraburkholderia bannensis]
MSSINEGNAELFAPAPGEAAGLQRKIGWAGAFWVASGVPALMLAGAGD